MNRPMFRCGSGTGGLPASAAFGAILSAISTVLLAGCWPACGPATGVVAHVIDGDTVELANGTRVRLLSIDAPEADACWGAQSTAGAVSLLQGRKVALRYATECFDDYDRLLAHVIVDGEDASLLLASGGLACAWILQRDQDASPVREAARQAARQGVGLWGACPEVPCRSN